MHAPYGPARPGLLHRPSGGSYPSCDSTLACPEPGDKRGGFLAAKLSELTSLSMGAGSSVALWPGFPLHSPAAAQRLQRPLPLPAAASLHLQIFALNSQFNVICFPSPVIS